MNKLNFVFISFTVFILFFGCQSTEQSTMSENDLVQNEKNLEDQSQPEQVVEQEPEQIAETEPVIETKPEPVVEPEPELQVEPEIIEPEPDLQEFIVSEETYEKTLEDIEKLINEISTVINERDFNDWKRYLADSYIDEYDSPEDLADYTDAFRRKGYDVRLMNLNDYFNYVVVASRQNLVIDHLEFVDETHLKVMTLYQNKPAVLYYLELINNEWKIAVW